MNVFTFFKRAPSRVNYKFEDFFYRKAVAYDRSIYEKKSKELKHIRLLLEHIRELKKESNYDAEAVFINSWRGDLNKEALIKDRSRTKAVKRIDKHFRKIGAELKLIKASLLQEDEELEKTLALEKETNTEKNAVVKYKMYAHLRKLEQSFAEIVQQNKENEALTEKIEIITKKMLVLMKILSNNASEKNELLKYFEKNRENIGPDPSAPARWLRTKIFSLERLAQMLEELALKQKTGERSVIIMFEKKYNKADPKKNLRELITSEGLELKNIKSLLYGLNEIKAVTDHHKRKDKFYIIKENRLKNRRMRHVIKMWKLIDNSAEVVVQALAEQNNTNSLILKAINKNSLGKNQLQLLKTAEQENIERLVGNLHRRHIKISKQFKKESIESYFLEKDQDKAFNAPRDKFEGIKKDLDLLYKEAQELKKVLQDVKEVAKKTL